MRIFKRHSTLILFFFFTRLADCDEAQLLNKKNKELKSPSGLLMSPITEPSEEQIRRSSLKYLFSDSLTTRAAFSFDQEALNLNGSTPLWIGAKYGFALPDFKRLEVGFDYTTADKLFISLLFQKKFNLESKFRPFYSWGLSGLPNGSEQIAGLINLDAIFLSGAVGFEDLIGKKTSVRIEIESKVNRKNQILLLSLGYSWDNIF